MLNLCDVIKFFGFVCVYGWLSVWVIYLCIW